ncbi:surface antigen [Chlorella sorokiniana]|uniref:Surface antigen n=1 Tax=Chlorella sorokiniana TaxID=3076 RepID=A0A2P6TV71_CHLSO|nr:surface antigen [Chlorella sorokiniana]|eukprot:PRW57967.1 surface antigen [Chlorella sorokiniana]
MIQSAETAMRVVWTNATIAPLGIPWTKGPAGKPRCESCNEGGLDHTTKSCKPCKTPHCQSCEEDAATCTDCAVGFRPDSAGTCEACRVTNCDDATTCTGCADGYRLNTAGACEACRLPHCLSCPDSANTCQICEPRYALDSKANRCFARR